MSNLMILTTALLVFLAVNNYFLHKKSNHIGRELLKVKKELFETKRELYGTNEKLKKIQRHLPKTF